MAASITYSQLDVSNPIQISSLIEHLNSGSSVRLLELIESDRQFKTRYTLLGRISEQEGSGIVIYGYTEKTTDSLVIIE